MTAPTGWGILATGRIAAGFADNLRETPGASIAAVGSRTLASATAFSDRYGGRPHGSYSDLVNDPDVDIVYVASPHALHLAHATLAFDAGKPVLCEKPLAMNLHEATAMIERAQAAGVFLMEAMWMACHPLIRSVRAQLQAGRFGQPRQVHADLGFVVDHPPESRMWDPALGASALLDMGIYPLTFAHLMLGPARRLSATAIRSDRGIDIDVAIAGEYDGAVAALTASMTSASPRTATIATELGRLDFADPFHAPPAVVWDPTGGQPEAIISPEPVIGSGLGNEALHVQECLRDGLLESPLVPHAHTLALTGQMDDLRHQIGVVLPSD